MNDQISRQKLIEELEKVKTGYGEGLFCEKGCGNFDNCPECVLARVQEVVESQPPADVPDTNVGEWIPCKTELPKKSGRYWVTFLWSGMPCTKVGYYDADEKKWSRSSYYPMAWKPYILPEPYKGVE